MYIYIYTWISHCPVIIGCGTLRSLWLDMLRRCERIFVVCDEDDADTRTHTQQHLCRSFGIHGILIEFHKIHHVYEYESFIEYNKAFFYCNLIMFCALRVMQ